MGQIEPLKITKKTKRTTKMIMRQINMQALIQCY